MTCGGFCGGKLAMLMLNYQKNNIFINASENIKTIFNNILLISVYYI